MAEGIFEGCPCPATQPTPAIYQEIRLNKQLPLIYKKSFVDRSNGGFGQAIFNRVWPEHEAVEGNGGREGTFNPELAS